MKNLNKSIVILLVSLSLTGCKSNLLDTLPSNEVSSESIWENANLATLAVTGVYNQLRANYTTNSASYPTWDLRSSLMDFDANWIGNLPQLRGTATPESADFLNYWKQLYEPIHRANDVIANIGRVPDMPDNKKSQYLAEVKFLRAYFYFKLNALWKGVPIYTEPVEASEANKPRSSEEDVWKLIISDLSDAIEESNLPDKYETGSSDFGRISKGAVYAFRGQVYLWTKEYQKAIDDFEKVKTLGYSLHPQYRALFKEATERNDEVILSIQFIEEAGSGNSFSWAFGNRGSAGAGWNNYIPNINFVDSYEQANGKAFNWDDFLPGYSSMTPRQRSVFFFRDNMTNAEIQTLTSYGADMTKYLPVGNEARIKAAYANRDPRMNMNIITPYSTYLGGLTGKDITYTLRWPYRGSDNAEPYDLRTDTNSKFYYLIRKFVFEGREHIYQSYSPIDLPIIRYAGVLLSLAEAYNEVGNTAESVKNVNLVRSRVGAQLLNSNSYTNIVNQNDLRERIRNEKYWELPFEEHMYFEELRWGTWKDKKFKAGNGLTEIWGTSTYTYSWIGEHNWIWPIPSSEIEMNRDLDQNPGWIN